MGDDGRSFADMPASTRRQETNRRTGADDLPKVSRSFSSVRDQTCESGYSGNECIDEISEGDEAAFVDGEIACETCFTRAQDTRDDFFDR